MSKVIMAGCDLHDRSMLIRYAVDTGEPQQLTYKNDAIGRRRMISRLKSLAKKSRVKRIVFAYEASGLGYGLADQLDADWRSDLRPPFRSGISVSMESG